ncbi:MAG: RluA family pseudouridine synthase [Candidatus Moranbacteria bacterium]|nr:RluA family pseudouridine synthase [Candidatus Moranbacteria bacterium]
MAHLFSSTDTFPLLISVLPETPSMRLDVFLTRFFSTFEPQPSRGDVVRLIAEDSVLVNGKSAKPSYRLQKNDSVSVLHAPTPILPEHATPNTSISVKIIARTPDFFVLNKSAGVQVHPSHTNPSSTLINGLLAFAPELSNVGDDPIRPGVVHRLDKDTSGVMVVARTQKTFLSLKNIFANRQAKKTYVALVCGHMKKLSTVVDVPIARSTNFRKQKIALSRFRGEARDAYTSFRVLARYHNYDLVEALPETGRMHQIRVHLAHVGTPVVGDLVYRPRSLSRIETPNQPPRQMLHALRLSFTLSDKEHSFCAPLEQDFLGFLQTIDESRVCLYDEIAFEKLLKGSC